MPYLVKPQDAVIGMHISEWTIITIADDRRGDSLCRCDCGREKTVKLGNVLRGLSKCCRPCSISRRMRTHGATCNGGIKRVEDRTYRIWKAMKWRCNPKNKTADHQMYYERGVRVCGEWANNYEAFRDWALANGYQDELSIDRYPDLNGSYFPANCRWVNQSMQARNTKSNHFLSAFGERKTIVEWSEDPRCTIKETALRRRLKLGWNDEDAITKPLKVRA